MKEKQITFSAKNHVLDNNDNFSPDDKYLCYDTRGTVFNDNLANCKSIEKVEISTGIETIIWEPKSITGEDAAPGVAAVSYHPFENKVVFIHGPDIDQVKQRAYYGIRNRTGAIVTADGSKKRINADKRTITTKGDTEAGAHRGGTHRHEYNRKGNRIGFTYDDFINTEYDRTIGYMEEIEDAPTSYTHYFSVLLKPAKEGQSRAGEIEKAYGDSWVDSAGTKRAFIGKVRAENGKDYETSLFMAQIPEDADIRTAKSGSSTGYPEPPKGIIIKRLTHNKRTEGIVRGSFDGKSIIYLAEDKNGVMQVFKIASDGSDLNSDLTKQPQQISYFYSDASSIRWHPSNKWIFAICSGNISIIYVGESEKFGKTFFLTNDILQRAQLVVSHSGNQIAYGIEPNNNKNNQSFKQIFIMNIDLRQFTH
ncbi:MAG: DUF3748 domain-containing protein [Bacteroidales bacterium]|nr:DUF3748 domain-containing protein [Bacteroidales bacterium]